MDKSYAVSYRAAMDAATTELDGLFEEVKLLRNRMEQIDSAINALKVLLPESDSTNSNEISSELNQTKQQIDSAMGLVFA
jgi:archaellum component FlaC